MSLFILRPLVVPEEVETSVHDLLAAVYVVDGYFALGRTQTEDGTGVDHVLVDVERGHDELGSEREVLLQGHSSPVLLQFVQFDLAVDQRQRQDLQLRVEVGAYRVDLLRVFDFVPPVLFEQVVILFILLFHAHRFLPFVLLLVLETVVDVLQLTQLVIGLLHSGHHRLYLPLHLVLFLVQSELFLRHCQLLTRLLLRRPAQLGHFRCHFLTGCGCCEPSLHLLQEPVPARPELQLVLVSLDLSLHLHDHLLECLLVLLVVLSQVREHLLEHLHPFALDSCPCFPAQHVLPVQVRAASLLIFQGCQAEDAVQFGPRS